MVVACQELNQTNGRIDMDEAVLTQQFAINAAGATKEITVAQKQKDALTITKNSFDVEGIGGQVEIEVVANIDFSYELSEGAEAWVTPVSTKGLESTKLLFDIALNKDIVNARTATITIKSGSLAQQLT